MARYESRVESKEITVAEMKKANYHTAMWGKWHLGEQPDYGPDKQGYDYAYYGLFNGAPDSWDASFQTTNGTPTPVAAPFHDFPGTRIRKKMTGITICSSIYR